MKWKTFYQGFGTLRAVAFGYAGYGVVNILSQIYSHHQKLGEFLLGEHPLEQKAIMVGYILGASLISVPIAAAGTLEGIVSAIKKEPFYAMEIWKKISKNPKTKKEIGEKLEFYNYLKDKEIKQTI